MDSLGPVKMRRLSRLAALACCGPCRPGRSRGARSAKTPARDPKPTHLRCPNLRIGPPTDLYVSTAAARCGCGRRSDVRSRAAARWSCAAPAAAGARCGPGSGSTAPAAATRLAEPRRRCTSPTSAPTSAAATGRSTSRPASSSGRSTATGSRCDRVRNGPKLNYCLRDLERTRPGNARRRSGLPRLQPGSLPRARHPRHLGRLVGHLPRRLRQAVGQRRRPARLLRLRDEGRPRGSPLESNEATTPPAASSTCPSGQAAAKRPTSRCLAGPPIGAAGSSPRRRLCRACR